MQRIRLTYSKGVGSSPEDDLIRFIGHLDMVRLWERTLRRTDLPVAYSEGFNPRQKMAFGPPLALGMTSTCEVLDMFFTKWSNPDLVKDTLNQVIPPGIKIHEAKNIFTGAVSITAQISTALYELAIDADVSEKIIQILESKIIPAKRKDKEINIRPMIKGIKQENGTVFLEAQCNNNGAMKLLEISSLFDSFEITSIKRTALY